MTSRDTPEGAGPEQSRLDNGLRAATYVPLTDVDAVVGQALLSALGRARIAAYLGVDGPIDSDRRRLFVAAEERVDARTIVAAAVRAMSDGDSDADSDTGAAEPVVIEPAADPLAGLDTDELFNALVANWHVDTHAAIREAERDLTREDADWRARLNKPPVEDPVWLDDDHYVPPPPPPLPRLAAVTVLAIVILIGSIVILGFGLEFGLPGNLSFVLGIGGILLSAGMLLTRVRDFHRDEDDDGAAI
jgi:hypothetical protein